MWPFSEMSLATASLVGTTANWLLLISLLGGVLSTFVIVKTTDIKEEHWAEDRRHSNERIAELSAQAAESTARTKEAEVKLAEVEARNEKRAMPRDLFVTRSAINAALVGKPTGRAEILWKKGVPDGDGLASAIVSGFMGFDPFKEPHWKIERVEPVDELPENARPTGITVIGRRGGKFVFSMFPNPPTSDDPMDIVGSALMKGMDHAVIQVGSGFDRALPDDLVRIVIGPKP